MAKGRTGFLAGITIIALIALVATLEMKRQTFQAQMQRLTVHLEQLQLGDSAKNLELAKKVIEEVRELIDIPEDVEPTVATIVDVELLREKNPFYEKAENGDHLVVTPDRAILYSSAKNKIIDVVPVQLSPAAPPEEGSGEQ